MSPQPKLKLLFVGDVMLGRLVNEALRKKPCACPWGDTLPVFRGADWRACNLECVISDNGSPWIRTPKTFHFRAEAKNVAVLKAARLNAVSLANNHALDYGRDALLEMLRLLDLSGIAHSGAGANLDEAARPALTHVRGRRVGLLSFTDNQPEWEAGPNDAGVFHVPIEQPDERTEHLMEMVHRAKQSVDFLVVAPHWGGNWGLAPSAAQCALARELVRAGADLIFGHSPHICRGIGVCDHRPILYSTGDFVDDYAVNPTERNDQSFIFIAEMEGPRVGRLTLRPTVIRHLHAELAKGEEARQQVASMIRWCGALGTKATIGAVEEEATIDLVEAPGLAEAP